jgi:hypothetical protein
MSKFTVIKGGGQGPPDRHSGAARYHLQQAIIETLRALVRGYDAQDRISAHLAEFIREFAIADAPLEVIVSDVIMELHKELDHQGERDIFEQEREAIVLAALQVAAEAMASDPGAKGRLSGRQSRLHSAIEHQLLLRQERARERRRHTEAPAQSKALRDGAKARKRPKPKEPGPEDEIIL